MALALSSAATACDEQDDTPADTGGAEANSMNADSGDDQSQTSADADSADDGSGGDATTDSGDSADTQADSQADSSDDAGETGPAPNGESCEVDADCQSMKCHPFMTGDESGGICSDCLTTDECTASGMGSICGYDFDIGFFSCVDADIGDFCENAESCREGQFCAEVFGDQFLTCSLCGQDTDCEGEQLCVVIFESEGDTGPHRNCVDPGSLEDGSACDLEGSGEAACINHCAAADLGDFTLGVCGACRPEVPEDCPEGTTCTPPQSSQSETVPSVCE